MENQNNIFLVIIVLFFLCWIMQPRSEAFDAKTVEFVPVGDQRYGLRGDKLRSGDIARLYIGPRRKIAVHPSSEIMWESDLPPYEEAIPGCKKVPCPSNENDFDKLDTCYQCGTSRQEPWKIPPIHPHVPN